MAVVPRSTGDLRQGNVLVSNFNDSANVQAQGRPSSRSAGRARVTVRAGQPEPAGLPGRVGLTTALSVLRSGWVIVGSLPTRTQHIRAGCLIVLDPWATCGRRSPPRHQRPWDMTAADFGGR